MDKSLEIIVSGAKETSSTIIRQGNTSAGLFNPSALPRGLAAMDRLQQHSIESSVVTEVELSWLNCDKRVRVHINSHNPVFIRSIDNALIQNQRLYRRK